MLSTVAIIQYIFLNAATFALATQTPSTQVYGFDVKQEVRLTRNLGGYLRMEADLGVLPRSQHGRISLKVINTTGEEIALGSALSGCNCLKGTLSDSSLAANGTVTLTLELETPRTAKRYEQMIAASIRPTEQNTQPEIDIRLKYQLEGLVAFRDQMQIVDIPQDSSSAVFILPIINKSDCSPDELLVRTTSELKSLTTSFVDIGDGQLALKCTFKLPSDSFDSSSGEISIQTPNSQFDDSITCLIQRKADVTIAPSPMLFFEQTENWKGSLILRIRTDDAEDRLASEGVNISANIIDVEVNCKFKRLAKGVYRVYLDVPKPDEKAFVLSPTEHELFLVVKLGGSERIYKCMFRIKTFE